MEKEPGFIGTEKLIEEIDEKVLKTAKRLKDEGLDFDLSIANENQISLKINGHEITFTKIDPYTIKKDGKIFTRAIEKVIEERIRELAPIEKGKDLS